MRIRAFYKIANAEYKRYRGIVSQIDHLLLMPLRLEWVEAPKFHKHTLKSCICRKSQKLPTSRSVWTVFIVETTGTKLGIGIHHKTQRLPSLTLQTPSIPQ